MSPEPKEGPWHPCFPLVHLLTYTYTWLIRVIFVGDIAVLGLVLYTLIVDGPEKFIIVPCPLWVATYGLSLGCVN